MPALELLAKLSGRNHLDSNIFKYAEVLTAVTNRIGLHENLKIIPNPCSNEAILKIPDSFTNSNLSLSISSVSGIIYEVRKINPAFKYEKLNALNFPNGIYIIELSAEKGNSIYCKWIINH